ncbi:MAG: hypothetical protein ACLS3M_03740 [Collinsella sp.]
MGSYDQRGGIDPATLAFIDRGGWDAFQPIVRNRNFAKTQRRIGTLLDSPGYSEASDAEFPLAEPQLGSIPQRPSRPIARRAPTGSNTWPNARFSPLSKAISTFWRTGGRNARVSR